MALVAASSSESDGGCAGGGDELLLESQSLNPTIFMANNEDSPVITGEYNMAEQPESSSLSSGLYSEFTFPIERGTTSGNYMPPNFGKSPEFVVRLPRETSGQIGQPVSLECQIDGHPLPDIMWTKDDDDITESDDPNYSFELDAVVGLCRLTIEKCRDSDQGTYRCFLENCFGACSSSTSLTISENKLSVSNNSSINRNSNAQSSSSAGLSSALSSQMESLITRELTTISEHLSQEEGGMVSFSQSVTEDPTPIILEEKQVTSISSGNQIESCVASGEEVSETASTVTNNSTTPMEVSMIDNNDAIVDLSTEGQDSFASSPDSVSSGTVRTVVNFDPSHLRQFCITPVQSRDEQTSPGASPLAKSLEDCHGQIQAECLSSLVATPSFVKTSSEIGDSVDAVMPPIVAIEEPTPPYHRRQLLIHTGATDLTELSERDFDPKVDRALLEELIAESAAPLSFSQPTSEGDVIGDAKGNLHSSSTELPKFSPSPSPKISFTHCGLEPPVSSANNSSTHSSTQSLPLVPISRTMSSPSSVPSQRRSSFFDSIIDNDPKTKRRTIILQSLIAIQITFLAVLAIIWQERLIAAAFGDAEEYHATQESAITKSHAKAAMKATKVAATTFQRVATNPVNYLAIITTPLSFIFVLIISSFITFVFISSIQL